MSSQPNLNYQGREWLNIKTFVTKRLEQLRVDNDKHSDPTATAAIRGRIMELKAILNWERRSEEPHD